MMLENVVYLRAMTVGELRVEIIVLFNENL